MTVRGSSDLTKVTPWGFGTSCLVLALALAVAAVPLGAWRAQNHADGWYAAMLAWFIVWFGGTLALLVATLAKGTALFVHAQLGGMLFRVGLPLGAVMVLQASGGELAKAGAPQCLVILYLVGLVVETLLVLPMARQAAARTTGRAVPAAEVAPAGCNVADADAAKEPGNHG